MNKIAAEDRRRSVKNKGLKEKEEWEREERNAAAEEECTGKRQRGGKLLDGSCLTSRIHI